MVRQWAFLNFSVGMGRTSGGGVWCCDWQVPPVPTGAGVVLETSLFAGTEPTRPGRHAPHSQA